MKKKHLKSLNSIGKWLEESKALTEEIRMALDLLRGAVNASPDAFENNSDGNLPAPGEIADEPRTLALYTDGGCRGNPGPGAYAFVLQRHDGQILGEGVEFDVMTTNNRMELLGVIRGLSEARNVLREQNQDPLLTKIKVVTDSKYVVDGMKSWVDGWKQRGWRKADNKAPENLELWQALDQERQRFMQIEWMWVKGHAGHPQNEYCDRKANEVMDHNS